WKSASGQFGKTEAGWWYGSEHVGPVPFVHPGAPTSPFAFDQPPAYHAQSTFAAESSSPIVGCVCGGNLRLSAVPGEYGWYHGCVVFTAKSPHATNDGVGGLPAGGVHEAVSCGSRTADPSGDAYSG